MKFDKKQVLISEKYATALLKSALEKGKIKETFENLVLISNTLKENSELEVFLNNPVISKEDKKDVIVQVFSNVIEKDTLNFICILVESNRFNVFNTILYSFGEQLDEANNLVNVTVISAVELPQDRKENLKSKLEEKINKQVKLNFQIDETIISGLILQTKDKKIDLSLKNKFNELKRQLM